MRFILLFMGLLFSQMLTAQDSISTRQLTEINVTDNRLSIPFRESAHAIIVIRQEQIQAYPAHSTVELLQHFAGIDVRQRGVHGVQADISLRGSSFEQVLILMDGIPLIDPQTGHHSLNLPISKESIQRIEIIKGPAARIYGPNAFAGAINIVTKPTKKHQVSATFEAGDFGLWKGQVYASLPKSGTSISLSTQESNGYKYNTDYQLTNGFIRQDWHTKQAHWKLLGGMTSRKFGANGFYASPKFKDQYEEIQTSVVALQMTTKRGKWDFSPRLYWRRNQDMYLFIRLKPEVYRNMHISQNFGAELNTKYKHHHWTTGIGLSANRYLIQSNNLGPHERTALGLFLEERIQLFDNQLDIIPGLNLHYYSDFGARLFPGLDIGWRPNKAWKAYANIGYTWRTPSYTDLFYESQANIGNPNLAPESALTIEAGTKYHQKNWSASLAIFHRDGKNIIDWTKSVDTAKWQPNNFNQVIADGLETEISFHPSALPFRLSANYTYIQTDLTTTESVLSRYALNNLKHQFNSDFDFRFAQKGRLNISYRYLDRVTLPDYDLWDAKISWTFSSFAIFAQANNLLNESYTETNLVQMPGRWFVAGIRFQ
ncbi:MAG TPA: TonB-dependent receptor [Saprospiraceae bacterium]|nr:TonB-dependent receptor [Saprospiraceae bacterium]